MCLLYYAINGPVDVGTHLYNMHSTKKKSTILNNHTHKTHITLMSQQHFRPSKPARIISEVLTAFSTVSLIFDPASLTDALALLKAVPKKEPTVLALAEARLDTPDRLKFARPAPHTGKRHNFIII